MIVECPSRRQEITVDGIERILGVELESQVSTACIHRGHRIVPTVQNAGCH